MWGSLAAILTAGALLLYLFESEVRPYIGYFVGAVGATAAIDVILTWMILGEKPLRAPARVMAKVWTGLILAVAMTGLVITVPKIAMVNFSSAPYLTWASDQDPSKSITVSWISSGSADSQVHYGVTRGALTLTATGQQDTRFHHVAITSLLPNTTYYYRAAAFPVKEFTTAPAGAFNYSFAFWSDHRTNNLVESVLLLNQPNVVESMAATGSHPAFSIFTGDMSSQSNDYQGWDMWFRDISHADWASNRTLQIAYGNHERFADTDARIVQQYFPYTQQPDGHFYYSFDYGVAHYIILDPYAGGHGWTDNFTDGQLAWLESDLLAHQDANFTMIFMHPPPWALSGVKADLIRLSAMYPIDLICCGHDHGFSLRNMNGTQVLMLGLGGNPGNDYAAFPIDTAFAQIQVTPTALRVIAQFINASVLADFTMDA